MIQNEDLEIAVTRGVISPTQAEALTDIARARIQAGGGAVRTGTVASAGSPVQAGEEGHFRLLGGFNDVFLLIGSMLFVGGLAVAVSKYPEHLMWASGGAALVVWGLAEVLTARMRLTLPSIFLVIAFVAFTSLAGTVAFVNPRVIERLGANLALNAVTLGVWLTCIPLVAALVHYWRFRVPFTMVLIAASLLAIVFAAMARKDITWPLIYLNHTLLAAGFCVFVAAMWYDMADVERTSRSSDNAFWLHMMAASLIVHTTVGWLIGAGGPTVRATGNGVGAGAGMVFAAIAILALVSVIIDRRALLVSGLVYLAGALGYFIQRLGHAPDVTAMLILFSIGAFVLVLGVGWKPLRRLVMGILPGFIPRHKLPPVQR